MKRSRTQQYRDKYEHAEEKTEMDLKICELQWGNTKHSLPKTLITVHLIALLEFLIYRICIVAAKNLNILGQILAHVFIHDRKQKEELFIDSFLLNSAHTVVENTADKICMLWYKHDIWCICLPEFYWLNLLDWPFSEMAIKLSPKMYFFKQMRLNELCVDSYFFKQAKVNFVHFITLWLYFFSVTGWQNDQPSTWMLPLAMDANSIKSHTWSTDWTKCCLQYLSTIRTT